MWRLCRVGQVSAHLILCMAAAFGCQCWGRIDAAHEPSDTPAESSLSGTTYFVDADNGNDMYSGRLAESTENHLDGPFKTIQAGYDRLRRGDCLRIKKGVYRETVTLYKKASASSPIVVQALPGDEGKVVINAAEEVHGWQRCTSQAQCAGNPDWQHIFYARVDSDVKQLFQKGSCLRPSRYPDQGWQYPTATDPSHRNTTFFDSTLQKPEGYFAGSICHVKTALWHMDHIEVSAYSARDGRITLALPTLYEISLEFGYYFTNVISAINEPGEWAYDSTRRCLYLWPEDESLENIETSVREYGINTSQGCSYHVIEGLAIKYAAEDGIRLYMTDHMTVRNNTIDYSYSAGLEEYEGTYAQVIGNTVSFSNVRGITDRTPSSFDLVQGNTVYATGAQNFGDDVAGDEGQGIFIGGDHTNVIDNRVDRSSYDGIYVDGNTCGREIAYNYITDSCLAFSDGGGIYTGGHSDSSVPDYYHHNIIANVWGYLGGYAAYKKVYSQSPELCRGGAHGIYLDEEGNNRVFENNTVLNCGAAGIYFHWTQDNRLTGNTAYGNAESQICFDGKDDPRFVLRGNDMVGNLLIATELAQVTFQLNTDYRDVHFGNSDGNYFYHSTGGRHIRVCRDVRGLGCGTLSPGEWQQLSGLDYHSKDLSLSANTAGGVPVIFTNPSMATAQIDLGAQRYRNVDGVVVEGRASLGPFGCLVLFPQPTAADGDP